jgi:basic membrane lipoprotein Med (substrate-binding protein (PBP1-ABC) superfamily)
MQKEPIQHFYNREEKLDFIIKESKNSKNLISITFDKHQVAYKIFHFS